MCSVWMYVLANVSEQLSSLLFLCERVTEIRRGVLASV